MVHILNFRISGYRYKYVGGSDGVKCCLLLFSCVKQCVFHAKFAILQVPDVVVLQMSEKVHLPIGFVHIGLKTCWNSACTCKNDQLQKFRVDFGDFDGDDLQNIMGLLLWKLG